MHTYTVADPVQYTQHILPLFYPKYAFHCYTYATGRYSMYVAIYDLLIPVNMICQNGHGTYVCTI